MHGILNRHGDERAAAWHLLKHPTLRVGPDHLDASVRPHWCGIFTNMGRAEGGTARIAIFLGDSLAVVRGFPNDVQDEVGYALWLAQTGGKHWSAKPLRGLGGASVLEIVEDDDGDTYRCVYTVKHPDAVYVLHAFQKESKSGSSTPRHHLDLVK